MRRLVRRGRALLAALVLSGAAATDADDLTAALLRARTLEARGSAEVTVLFPPRDVPTRTVRALPRVPFRPALLARNFTVKRVGPDTVAGRPTTRFDLVPKVGEAAHWSLWIDTQWNLPLGYQETFPDGTPARRAVFTAVSGPPAAVRAPVPALPAGLRAAVLAALPGLRLPPGVVPSEVRDRPNGRTEITLTDGVNMFALVTAPRGVRAAPGVASRRVDGGFVWLVGNLPGRALQDALAQVRRVDAPGLNTLRGTFLTPGASDP